jgi:hypothetical protein
MKESPVLFVSTGGTKKILARTKAIDKGSIYFTWSASNDPHSPKTDVI